MATAPWYLNPWVNASDTLNLSTGNPYLDPELNHAVELAHSMNTDKGFSVNTALYWRYTNNAIEYLSTVNAEGVSISMPKNIAQRKNYGVNINISGQLTKNWNLNSGADLRYVDLKSPSMNMSNEGLVLNFNVNSTYKFPKNYSMQAFGSVGTG